MAKKRRSKDKPSHPKPGRFIVGDGQFSQHAEAPAESGQGLNKEKFSGLPKDSKLNSSVVDQAKCTKPVKVFEHRVSVAQSAIRWIASTAIGALASTYAVGFAVVVILLILLIAVPLIYGPFIDW